MSRTQAVTLSEPPAEGLVREKRGAAVRFTRICGSASFCARVPGIAEGRDQWSAVVRDSVRATARRPRSNYVRGGHLTRVNLFMPNPPRGPRGLLLSIAHHLGVARWLSQAVLTRQRSPRASFSGSMADAEKPRWRWRRQPSAYSKWPERRPTARDASSMLMR